MENITLGLIIGALGASTVIGFIANLWRDSSNSKEKIPELQNTVSALQKEVNSLKEIQAQDRLNVANAFGEVKAEFAKINQSLDYIVKKLE